MTWHSGKGKFNTVDEFGILQLVTAPRKDLVQQDEHRCYNYLNRSTSDIPFDISLQFFTGQREKNLLLERGVWDLFIIGK